MSSPCEGQNGQQINGLVIGSAPPSHTAETH